MNKANLIADFLHMKEIAWKKSNRTKALFITMTLIVTVAGAITAAASSLKEMGWLGNYSVVQVTTIGGIISAVLSGSIAVFKLVDKIAESQQAAAQLERVGFQLDHDRITVDKAVNDLSDIIEKFPSVLGKAWLQLRGQKVRSNP